MTTPSPEPRLLAAGALREARTSAARRDDRRDVLSRATIACAERAALMLAAGGVDVAHLRMLEEERAELVAYAATRQAERAARRGARARVLGWLDDYCEVVLGPRPTVRAS